MKSGWIVALALAAVAAEAQQKIEVKTTSAVADGRVVIDSQAGTIHVVGWARDAVEVGGTLGRGAEGLNLNSHGARTDVEVETRGNPHGVRSDLEIKVPAASQIEIDSFSADVRVEGVTGRVRIETVNGGLAVSGPAQEIDAQSVNGRVDIAAACPRIHAESVNGAVTIKGARGEIEASTVNGRLVVSGEAFQKGSLSGVSGSVQFEGALAERGWLEVETVSGGRRRSARTSTCRASAAGSKTSWVRRRARRAATRRSRSCGSRPAAAARGCRSRRCPARSTC